jgi:hypothetical protein
MAALVLEVCHRMYRNVTYFIFSIPCIIIWFFIILQQNAINNYRFIVINLKAYYSYMFLLTRWHLLCNKPPPPTGVRMQMTTYFLLWFCVIPTNFPPDEGPIRSGTCRSNVFFDLLLWMCNIECIFRIIIKIITQYIFKLRNKRISYKWETDRGKEEMRWRMKVKGIRMWPHVMWYNLN